jgi:hypothetical protein
MTTSKASGCCLLALVGLMGYRAIALGSAIASSVSLPSLEPAFRMDELLLGRELLSVSIVSPTPSNSTNTLNYDSKDEEPLAHQLSASMPRVDNETRPHQSKHAYVPSLGRNVTLPLPVVLYPFVVEGSKGEQAMQICENGVRESPYLTLTTLHDFDPNVVWLLDTSKNLKRFCIQFTQEIRKVQALRAQQGLATTWPIHLFDNGDEPMVHECKSLENLVGNKNYHYHKRSIVVNRHWDETTNWIHVGEKLEPSASMIAATGIENTRFHHVNIPVRTDMVQAIAQFVDKQFNLTINDDLESAFDRPLDVAHFWPRNKENRTKFFSSNAPTSNNNKRKNNMQVQDGFLVQSSNLRDSINLVLDNLDGSPVVVVEESNNHVHKQIKTFAGAQGRGRMLGRSIVQEPYLEKLMATKIHVVSQRDTHEDHFRLLEALVSGAMVMTDEMLTLPSGLEHGVSLVVYHSAQDLAEKIHYYLTRPKERLAIARTGRRIALSRHRAQHRIEEMMFGTPLSVICQDCPLTIYPGAS